MPQTLSFQLLSDRVVRQRTLIESDKNIIKMEQKQMDQSQLLQHNPLQQSSKEFVYTSKTISHKFLPLLAKHTQALSKEPDLIRNDIFLIRVKVNKIRVENQPDTKLIDNEKLEKIKNNLNQQFLKINEKPNSNTKNLTKPLSQENTPQQLKQALQLLKEVQNYALHNLINGKTRFRIIQKNPFYLPLDQFEQRFKDQLKTIQPSFIYRIQAPNPDQIFRPINNQIQKLTNLVVQNFEQENTKHKKKSKHSNSMSKISKQTLLRMVLSSFQSSNLNQKDQKPFNIYQQNYELLYKRQSESQKQKAHTQEDQDQREDSHTEKQVENKLILQSRPNLNNLFQKDDSLMFAGTEESVFEMKFEQLELFEAVQHLNDFILQKSENLPGFNLFWANFRLKNFCHIPFTQHLLTVKLDHKLQNRQNQQKRLPKEQKIKFVVDLSMYLVPGNQNGWGILKIDEITVNWKDFIAQDKQKRLVKLKIEFPDVVQRNRRLIKSQQSQVETKIQTLDHGENPVWTEDLFIKINPQRNKLCIMLIEMEENRFDVKSTIAERTIFLLEEGFLFDRVQSTRHILLKSKVGTGEKGPKTADLIISFSFEIAMNDDQIAQEKSVSDKSNAFVNHFNSLQ